MIYFTSDFHFAHKKPFLFEPRGFSNVDDMNRTIIENYNSIIKDDDQVFILGDCILSDDDEGMRCLIKLKGEKYLAFGNHDTDSRLEKYDFANIFYGIDYGYRMRYDKFSFWCQHYPAKMGNYKDKHPTWCLSGHTHSKDKFQYGDDCIYNVAMDAHNCFPVSIEQIVKDIKEYRKTHPIIPFEKENNDG